MTYSKLKVCFIIKTKPVKSDFGCVQFDVDCMFNVADMDNMSSAMLFTLFEIEWPLQYQLKNAIKMVPKTDKSILTLRTQILYGATKQALWPVL